MTLEILTKQKFSSIIEDVVTEKQLSYMDAIVWWCEKNDCEIDVAAKLITPLVKEKIRSEAQDLNFIQKTPRVI